MKTYFPTKEEASEQRKWVVVDARDQVVGRLASQIANILRGKTKAAYNPHNDMGDFVVVINADKVRFTGNKEEKKVYYHHTLFAGGVRQQTARQLRERHPARIIETAVKGMMPHNALGRAQLKKLKVYVGSEHPHQAQQPQPLELTGR